jgi:hypothetical protein
MSRNPSLRLNILQSPTDRSYQNANTAIKIIFPGIKPIVGPWGINKLESAGRWGYTRSRGYSALAGKVISENAG